MTKCKLHPNYNGHRAPKRNTKNPEGGVFENGCPTCLDIHREWKQEQVEAARPVKHRSERAVASKLTAVQQKFDMGKLRIGDADPDTGEYPLFYGTRCLYTGTSLDSVYDFMAGFSEGLNFNFKDHVGDA